MKLLKIALGLLVIGAAIFIIVGEQLAGASADAVVNARLTTVRAPIAGRLDLETRDLGVMVAKGETLGALSDPLVDDIRLNDLVQEHAIASAEVSRLEREIEGLEQAAAALRERAKRYSAERVGQLETRLAERQARSRAVEARLEEANAAFSRSNTLKDRGVETAAALDRAKAAARISERELEATRADIRVAEIELAAARSGVFLGEGYNDAPYSEQRISELSVEIGRDQARVEAEKSRVAALELRIEAERRRTNRLGSAPIVANVRGRLWEVLAADGERMQRGQDLMRLVDCGSTFVTLSVSEGVYNTLKVGDAAEFRMSGETRVLSATIVRLAGSGAETIYRNLAVAPSRKHLERYDVALNVPELLADSNLFCAIGRTGRVFFADRPLDGLRRLFD